MFTVRTSVVHSTGSLFSWAVKQSVHTSMKIVVQDIQGGDRFYSIAGAQGAVTRICSTFAGNTLNIATKSKREIENIKKFERTTALTGEAIKPPQSFNKRKCAMYIFVALIAKQHSVIIFKFLWRTSTFLSVREVDCNFKKISRFLYNCITQVKIRKLKHPVEYKFPLF